MAGAMQEAVHLKKRITELVHQVEAVEERFVLGELTQPLYLKYLEKYKLEIDSLQEQLAKNGCSSSNLQEAVEKGMKIARNISKQWASADFDQKRKLQYLLFSR